MQITAKRETKYLSVVSISIIIKVKENIPQTSLNKRKSGRTRSSLMMMTAPFMAAAMNGDSAIKTSRARTFILAVNVTLLVTR